MTFVEGQESSWPLMELLWSHCHYYVLSPSEVATCSSFAPWLPTIHWGNRRKARKHLKPLNSENHCFCSLHFPWLLFLIKSKFVLNMKVGCLPGIFFQMTSETSLFPHFPSVVVCPPVICIPGFSGSSRNSSKAVCPFPPLCVFRWLKGSLSTFLRVRTVLDFSFYIYVDANHKPGARQWAISKLLLNNYW